MLNRFVFVNLDNILIFSNLQHVRAVLQRLLENSLFVKAQKCEFHLASLSFQGIISPTGVQMDPIKVSALVDWPVPDSRNQLQRFLGFANFYQLQWCGSATHQPLTSHSPTSPVSRGRLPGCRWLISPSNR